MTIQFKENSRYLLEQSIFNREEGIGFRRILTCHCVQDGIAYLSDTNPSSQIYTEEVEYKYNIKKERMYVFNKVFQTWDNCEGFEITEFAVESVNTNYQSVNVV